MYLWGVGKYLVVTFLNLSLIPTILQNKFEYFSLSETFTVTFEKYYRISGKSII